MTRSRSVDADAPTITGMPPDTATYQNLITAGFPDTWAAIHP